MTAILNDTTTPALIDPVLPPSILRSGTWHKTTGHVPFRDNADLIARGVVPLGHLRTEWLTWDLTWGKGAFWRDWEPDLLIGSDINPAKPVRSLVADGTRLPARDKSVDVAVVDAPYKLNGRSDGTADEPYGVDVRATRDERHGLMGDLLVEGFRVARHRVLCKCQNMVNSGRLQLQTELLHGIALGHGWTLADYFELHSFRPQPARGTCSACARSVMRRKDGRWGTVPDAPGAYECAGDGPHLPVPDPQDHAYADGSTLLVFTPITPAPDTTAALF